MAFCPNCGSAVEGRFCAKCGATVAAGGPPPNPAPSPTPSYSAGVSTAPGQAAAGSGLAENVASTLCYVLTVITGIIFLVMAPYNQNRVIRFNAFQAIFFFAAMFVVYIALMIVSIVLRVVPVLGAIISLLLYFVVWIGSLVTWIYLMVKSYQGQKVVLPVIGPMAEKQANS